jgi:hypothetical protein
MSGVSEKFFSEINMKNMKDLTEEESEKYYNFLIASSKVLTLERDESEGNNRD